jgi:L-lactate dehydrogenase (cytochrome)
MIQHSAPAPIDVLYEMRHTKPELFDKLEVYVDSGVRRGTDVVSTRKSPGKACHDPLTSTPLPTRQSQVKALALGATAVGLGRPFLYGNGTYGEEGCAKVYEREYNGNAKSLRVGALVAESASPFHSHLQRSCHRNGPRRSAKRERAKARDGEAERVDAGGCSKVRRR